MDRTTTALVHCNLHKEIAFGDLLCVPDVVLVVVGMLLPGGVDRYGGNFVFPFFLFSPLDMCILDVLRHPIFAEARCNCYLHDINIFPFKKIGPTSSDLAARSSCVGSWKDIKCMCFWQ